MQIFIINALSGIRQVVTCRFIQYIFPLGILAFFAGCQTYKPQVLSLSDYSANLKERSPSSAEVEAFAKRLAESDPDQKAFDPADGLSLKEAETVALVYNPELRLARLKLGLAKATADHAGLWKDPVVGFDVLKITESVPDPWIVGSTLSLTVPISGRLEARKEKAAAGVKVELDRVAEAEWKMLGDLRKVWLLWSAKKLYLEETEGVLAILDSMLEPVSKLVEAGEMLKTEAALFVIAHEEYRDEVEHLKAEIEAFSNNLRSIIGLSMEAELELVPVLVAVKDVSVDALPDKTNLTLARLRSEYQLAERALKAEVRKQYPDLVIGPQVEEHEGQSRIGVIGAFPLPILNSNRGGIAEARIKREMARAAFEVEYERIVARLSTLQTLIKSLEARRLAMSESLVPLVDRQLADIRSLIAIGEGESLILLESLRRAHQAKLKLIDIQLERSEVSSEIRFILGPENRNLISNEK